MVPSRCLSLAVGLLLIAIPNPAFSDSVFDPVTDSDPDPNDENAPQDGHLHGCMLFLNEDHTPQEPLVGKDFEAFTTSGYKVEDEAGSTAASCTDGRAGGYPCNNIDLMSVMELSELDGETSSNFRMANDIWGWTHSGREFAIVGLKSGTAFVEITDPYNPVLVGKLPARNNAYSSWRDIKTCQDHAYIVTEAKQGMQIFDLKRLLNATPTTTFDADAIYDEFENAHNIFINEEEKTAYVVGSNKCGGGLHIIDLTLPLAPSFKKCFADDGYTHDVQCVNYSGPDADYQGKEICIASNEDTVTIIDQSTGTMLSRVGYEDDRYTHQGWLTEDHKFFIFNDELDEYRLGGKTRTHVLDVTELSEPSYLGYYEGRTAAIDHNNYVLNDQVYQANYRAGLNILKIVDPSKMEFKEEAFFDIYPNSDSNNFNGAWSNYPYLPSGNIIVSGIEQGLFVLKQTSRPGVPTSSPSPSASPSASPVASTGAPSPLPPPCDDNPEGWFDSDGPTYDCEWYDEGTNCAVYGDRFAREGKTANEACCACGGGNPEDPEASPSPSNSSVSASPTISQSAAPTASPVNSPSAAPSASPVNNPSAAPTASPVNGLSAAPSASPVLSDQCPSGQAMMVLTVKADSKSKKQNIFTVKKRNANKKFKIQAWKKNKFPNNQVNVYKMCMDTSGCYKTIMKDKGKNGMCCANGEGGYDVTFNGVTIMDTLTETSFESGKFSRSGEFGQC